MGFAKEAAIACFEWGFRNVDCEHIVALTSTANTRSWGLMDTLGMKRRPELDFIEPWTPPVDVIVYDKVR